jgi:hypothetical protein
MLLQAENPPSQSVPPLRHLELIAAVFEAHNRGIVIDDDVVIQALARLTLVQRALDRLPTQSALNLRLQE